MISVIVIHRENKDKLNDDKRLAFSQKVDYQEDRRNKDGKRGDTESVVEGDVHCGGNGVQ